MIDYKFEEEIREILVDIGFSSGDIEKYSNHIISSITEECQAFKKVIDRGYAIEGFNLLKSKTYDMDDISFTTLTRLTNTDSYRVYQKVFGMRYACVAHAVLKNLQFPIKRKSYSGKMVHKLQVIIKKIVLELVGKDLPDSILNTHMEILDIAKKELDEFGEVRDPACIGYLTTDLYNRYPKGRNEYMIFVDLMYAMETYNNEQIE